jgi:iron complex transport system substrate-binding protein
VVTISDGLVEEVMTVLGVQDKLVGLGSECLPKVWQIDYPTVNGGNFSYHDGMNVSII